MFAEELAKIKEVEDQAVQLQKKSKSDSKKALEDARQEAEKIVSEAEMSAKENYGRLLGEGQEIAEAKYTEYIKKVEAESKVMIQEARLRENVAVDFIVERIVGTSVNN